MGGELAPAGLRSGPKIFVVNNDVVSAAHSSGSKLPRHRFCVRLQGSVFDQRCALKKTSIQRTDT
ncbi:hypothetical protein C1886_21310 [Pseudomonas sp. FW300-N1A1]|nr:hypothetical protein C1886_21310 [Pseudomonas sp. FW300-N1A1]